MKKMTLPTYLTLCKSVLIALVLVVTFCSSACVPKSNLTPPNVKKNVSPRKRSTRMEDLRRAAKEKPKDPDIWYLLGMAYYESRDYRPAAVSLEKAISLHLSKDKAREAYDKLGWSYYKMKEYRRAVHVFEKAMDLFPNWEAPMIGRACANRQQRKYAESLADFGELLAADPANLLALDNRGWTYYLMHRYEKALVDFQRAEELSNNNAALRSNVLNGQGWCHYMKGNFKTAVKKFNEAAAAAPREYPYGRWDAYRGMAFAQAGLGNFEFSYNLISKAQTALTYDPNHDLALLHYIAGNKKAAWHYLGQEGYIGLAIQPISLNGMDILYVAEVDADGPAEKAGMLPGDIIVALDEMNAPDLGSFEKRVKALRQGVRLPLTVSRNGVQKRIMIVVGAADSLILHDPLLAPVCAPKSQP